MAKNHRFHCYQDHKCIMELKEYLLKVCQEKDAINDLRLLLGEQAHEVGLLVSQRVVNLPPQLLPPMYDALFDEVSWATEDEPTEELRNTFSFKFYLLVCKIYKLKNAGQKKKQSSQSDEEIIYIKPEDEIFHQLSCWSFSFPMHTQQVETQEATVAIFNCRNLRPEGADFASSNGEILTGANFEPPVSYNFSSASSVELKSANTYKI
ncbi:hypothetical protein Pint_22333 [Pistacia integerrima]|uniref:Uncharacterized protein n=1 Tax=Pistacia integerrima TaxID=434235 RepID=A0ACC0YL71_9ROSI|nr:hypothetical protein Pint_22333 [Pistacia integerrima]